MDNLKKEFKQRDVQRMRNLINKDYGAATQIQTGYEKGVEEHKEGDIWEENGKKWTIKNGLKQTITKFDKIKQLVSLPYVCPNCNKPMKDHVYNRKMWAIHRKCFDCVIEMEAQLKVEGKYEQYEKDMMNGNKELILTDMERALDEWLNGSTSFITEAGDVESWGKKVGNDIEVQRVRDLIKKAKEQKI